MLSEQAWRLLKAFLPADKADAHMYKNKNAHYMGAHI
tara:strand:- start:488 stop:598 length:111 start_codon:yes stop_codon:yes gene_type:complete